MKTRKPKMETATDGAAGQQAVAPSDDAAPLRAILGEDAGSERAQGESAPQASAGGDPPAADTPVPDASSPAPQAGEANPGGANPASPFPEGTVLRAQPPAPSPDGALGPEPEVGEDEGEWVTVIGPAKGIRRAGFHFGAEPRTILVTPDQKKAMEADPALAVGPPSGRPDRPDQAPRRLTIEDFDDFGTGDYWISVIGPARGRRRAGYQFGPVAQTLEVTREELVLILGDAELSVSPG